MVSVAPSPALRNVQLTAENAALEKRLRTAETENQRIRRENAEQCDEIAELKSKVAELVNEQQVLQQHLKRLLRRPGDPALAPGQRTLFAEETETVAENVETSEEGESLRSDDSPDIESEAVTESDDGSETPGLKEPKKRKRRDRRKADESNLKREVRRSELSPQQRICPVTGLDLVEVGVEVSTELDYQAAELRIIEHHKVVYGLPPEAAKEREVLPLKAPEPPVAVEGVKATAELLAWVLCQKYVLHLPLYRQQDAFARLGVRLSRQTLCDWVMKCAFALRPVANEIWRQVRAGPILHLDDTRIKVKRAGPGGGKAKVKQSYLWVFINPAVGGVVYHFTVGRGADELADVLREGRTKIIDARGIPEEELDSRVEFTVGDGYAANRLATKRAAMKTDHAGCWSHVLRKFIDAEAEAPNAMGLFVSEIRAIYKIEEEGKEAGLGPEELLELRRSKATPLVANVLRMTRGWEERYSLSGRVAEAMTYVQNQRRTLTRFMRDGRVAVDNNVCEGEFCHVAVGRRNWLFAGSVDGAEAAAVIYTLVASAKRSGVDPLGYLQAVVELAGTWPASKISELTPWAMADRLPAYRGKDDEE